MKLHLRNDYDQKIETINLKLAKLQGDKENYFDHCTKLIYRNYPLSDIMPSWNKVVSLQKDINVLIRKKKKIIYENRLKKSGGSKRCKKRSLKKYRGSHK